MFLVTVLDVPSKILAQINPKSVTGVSLISPTSGSITASWTAPSAKPKDYRVSWRKDGQEFLTWKSPNVAGLKGNEYPTGSSVTISGLDSNSRYYVRIRARYDSGGPGPWSNTYSAVASPITVRQNPTAEPTAEPTAVPTAVPDYSPKKVVIEPRSDRRIYVHWDDADTPPTNTTVAMGTHQHGYWSNTHMSQNRTNCFTGSLGGVTAQEYRLRSRNHSSYNAPSGSDYDHRYTIPQCVTGSTPDPKMSPNWTYKVKVIGVHGDGSSASDYVDYTEVTDIRSYEYYDIDNLILNLSSSSISMTWDGSRGSDNIVVRYKSGSNEFPTVPDTASTGDSSSSTDTNNKKIAGYSVLAANATSLTISDLVGSGTTYNVEVYPIKENFILPKTTATAILDDYIPEITKVIPGGSDGRMKVYWNAGDSNKLPDKFVVQYESGNESVSISDVISTASESDQLTESSSRHKGIKFVTPSSVTSTSSQGSYEITLPFDTSAQLPRDREYKITVFGVKGDGSSSGHY